MKNNKIRYLEILAKDAQSLDIRFLILVLSAVKCIRKHRLQRLFDGILTGVAVFFLFEIGEPHLSVPASMLIATLFGCYVILSGGFYLPTEARSRSNSAD